MDYKQSDNVTDTVRVHKCLNHHFFCQTQMQVYFSLSVFKKIIHIHGFLLYIIQSWNKFDCAYAKLQRQSECKDWYNEGEKDFHLVLHMQS